MRVYILPLNAMLSICVWQVHKLENKWVWWYDERPKFNSKVQVAYEDLIKPIGFPRTAEAFWRYVCANFTASQQPSSPCWVGWRAGAGAPGRRACVGPISVGVAT